MQVLGCLGSANYWLSLPLLAVVGSIGVLQIVAPSTTRRWSRRQLPNAAVRLIGVATLVAAIAMASVAVHEARTDPDCRMESSTSP